MGWIIAIISGALMSIQGVLNTGVTKQTSIWVSSTFVQLTGFLVCIAAWYITGRDGNLLGVFKIDHKYMLLGGAIGAFITYTVIRSVDTLGPAKAIMIIVTSQLLMAYLIEVFGIFGVEQVKFQWRKLLGLALIIGGILTFKWDN